MHARTMLCGGPLRLCRNSAVVATLAKSFKTCVARLSTDKVCFVISERSASGGANVWCELQQSNFFDEYRIEGKDETNQIYLEVNMEQLARAFKSSAGAQVVRIKLTKKQGAFLTVEIGQPTGLSNTIRTIVHDIPISVVPQRLWSEYQEPDMPDIDVSIYLPPLKLLKTVLERMKTLSNYVTVCANMNGELRLRLETDVATATTYFKDLQNHQFADGSQSEESATSMSEACVDIKKFTLFFQGQFNPTKVVCNIINGKGLQLFLLHEDASIQYYIPAMTR